MAKLTDEDYAEMAADYAVNPPRRDEIDGEITVDRAVLPTGRPAGQSIARGKTPTTSLRLPTETRNAVNRLAAQTNVKPTEIIRRAVGEYIDRNPGAT